MPGLRDPSEHDELLNYRLKRLLALGGAPAIRLCEGRYGITRFEWRLVAALVESGAMSPMELVERVGVDPARTSRALKALVEKRLVRRERDSGDRRRAVASATTAGAALYAELFPRLAEINRRLVAALDDDEVTVLDRCLDKPTARAQQVRDAGDGVPERAERRLGGSRRSWQEGAGRATRPSAPVPFNDSSARPAARRR